MAEVFNKLEELKARAGKGSGLYTTHFQSDGLYAMFLAFIKVPFIKKSLGTLEVKVACSDTITKVEGITTLEEAETTIYLHRDSIRMLEKLDGKTIPLLVMLGNFTGWKYSGAISYTPNDVEMDALMEGTVKITPATTPEYIDDCFPLVKPTAQFKSVIPENVELETTTGKYEQEVEMKLDGSTFTATSGKDTIATATVTANKLVITGKTAGSTVISLISAMAGCASWETTIHVIVPKTTAPISK